MNTGALLMMVISFIAVAFMTIYYFVKVFRTPPRDPDHDSYTDTHS